MDWLRLQFLFFFSNVFFYDIKVMICDLSHSDEGYAFWFRKHK